MRALALSTAVLHLILCSVGAFFMFFVATFPWENLSPEDRAADDWLVGAAAVIVILALTLGAGVIRRRIAVAASALAAQFVAGAVIIGYALGESSHSDGKLALYALAVFVTAGAATVATGAARR